MNRIIAYLTFNGNCKEAMEFYQSCLGGELKVQTLGESPQTEVMPLKMKNVVVEASLKRESMILMGSDLTDDELHRGNSVYILLNTTNEHQMKSYYKKLAVGGQPIYPLEKSHYGTLCGGLTDKYGNHWLFHFEKEIH